MALFDSEGAPITAVDRSKPGIYHLEQVFSDSAGNTTTLRVTYEVRAEFVQTSLPAAGVRNGSGGAGTLDGYGGHYTQLALAQTGDFFGPCPLHPLFILLMVLASAYGMMKLRLESFARRRLVRQARAAAEEAQRRGSQEGPADQAEVCLRRMKLIDYGVFGLIGAAALVIAAVALCPYDLCGP